MSKKASQKDLIKEYLTDLHNFFIRDWYNIISNTADKDIDVTAHQDFFEYSRFFVKLRPVYFLVLGSCKYYNSIIDSFSFNDMDYMHSIGDERYPRNSKVLAFFDYIKTQIDDFNKLHKLDNIISCEIVKSIDSCNIVLFIYKKDLKKVLNIKGE